MLTLSRQILAVDTGAFLDHLQPPFTKREIEHISFRAVYNPKAFHLVEEQESPDFRVQPARNGSSFGVEITQIYRSESDARLQNIKDYLDELFAGKPHKHRDDVQNLPVTHVTVHDKDGNLKYEALPAIVRSPLIGVGDLLAEAIAAKNAKFPDYQDGLSHVNLIVCDRASDGPGLGEPYSSRDLLTDRLRQVLDASAFSEVFVFSISESGDQTVRPLRMITLGAICISVLDSLSPLQSEYGAVAGWRDLYSICIKCAEIFGATIGYSQDDDGMLVYGGSGVIFSEHEVKLIDFRDSGLPELVSPPDISVSDDELNRMLSLYSDFIGRHHAQLTLMFPVEHRVEETLLELRTEG